MCDKEDRKKKKKRRIRIRDLGSKKETRGTSLAVWWLRICLPVQGVQVQSLVRELRFPHASQPKYPQNIKQKQYSSQFSKDFIKNGPHQKTLKKQETDLGLGG